MAATRPKFPGAQEFVPTAPKPTLPLLRAAAQKCRGCDLYQNATQAVFGEGPAHARVVLVGEQPGDQEDQKGHPFVGPAGQLLDSALEQAGIDRAEVYVTNAVKHFKWAPAPTGKRRIHAKPTAGEVRACRPWLEHELGLLKPRVVVILGATAGQSLLGPSFRVGAMRGKPIHDAPFAPCVVATIHPSAVLRAPDDEARDREFKALVSDLKLAAKELAKLG
jgi:DNA polymerase